MFTHVPLLLSHCQQWKYMELCLELLAAQNGGDEGGGGGGGRGEEVQDQWENSTPLQCSSF